MSLETHQIWFQAKVLKALQLLDKGEPTLPQAEVMQLARATIAQKR